MADMQSETESSKPARCMPIEKAWMFLPTLAGVVLSRIVLAADEAAANAPAEVVDIAYVVLFGILSL